jgi:hypothetical protein
MKYVHLLYISAIISIVMIPVAAIASDITGANYMGTVQAINSGTAASGVSANFTVGIDELIAAKQLDPDARNIVARDSTGTDIPIMPGSPGNPTIIWFENIMAGVSQDINIYTGNVTGGQISYSPGPAGMTVPDTITEPANNFNWTFTGMYLNPDSTNATGILNHSDAANGGLEIGMSSGNATARVKTVSGSSSNSTAYRPNAAGTYAENTPLGGSNYACSGDNNDATYVYNVSSSYKKDTYNIPDHTTEDGIINSVTIYFRITNSGASTTYAKPLLVTHSTLYEGTEVTRTGTGWVNQNQTYTTNPNSGSAWTWAEIDALQIGTELKVSAGDGMMADCWIVINYNLYVYTDVSLSGITAVGYDGSLSLTGGTLSFTLGDSSNSTPFAGSIPNSSANWTLFGGDTVYFVESAGYSQGGTPVSAWEWEYGTTFHDSIGTSDATPSFRTASSDPDVTADLISYEPVSQAIPDSDTIDTWPEMVTTTPAQPSTMYSENATPGIFFAGVIHAIWPDSIPESLFWYNFAFVQILGAGILTYYIVASKGKEALLLKIIVMAVLMIFYALPGPNIYGMYTVIYFVFWSTGVLILSRNYGW